MVYQKVIFLADFVQNIIDTTDMLQYIHCCKTPEDGQVRIGTEL